MLNHRSAAIRVERVDAGLVPVCRAVTPAERVLTRERGRAARAEAITAGDLLVDTDGSYG